MVMVDGAHAPGQVQLNLKALNADFYTGNMHKWVYTPRGCALLWVRRDHHSWVHPLVTSWMLDQCLDWQFFNQGTRDHIPFICAKHAVQFYKAIGGMKAALQMQEDIYYSDDIQTIFDWVDGALYYRISMQIHNTKEDVRRAVPALKRLLSDVVEYSALG
nr:hypothetical protein BaRGS_013260 [Batillaria attramentaria]